MMPDDRAVVTGGDDGIARLWDVKTGDLKTIFQGHTGPVVSVAVTPDGAFVVTGSDDRTARVWDARSGQSLLELAGHSSEVTSVAISNDGRRVATASFDGTTRIWDLASGQELAVLGEGDGGIAAVTFAADGTRVVTMPFEGQGEVWDWSSSERLMRFTDSVEMFGNFIFQQDQALVGTLAVTPDGRHVVACNVTKHGRPMEKLIRGAVGVFDLETGRLQVLTDNQPGYTYAASPTPDGKHLVSVDSSLAIRIWNLQTGALEATFGERREEQDAGDGHCAFVNALAVMSDSRRLVTVSDDGTARVWDVSTGNVMMVIASHTGGRICAVAITPNGDQFVTGGYDGTARLWNRADGKLATIFRGHRSWIVTVAVSPDGHHLLTGSFDSTIRLWDLASGELQRTLTGHTGAVMSLAISPDSREAASVSRDKTVRLWDLGTGKSQKILDIRSISEAVAYTPGGGHVAVGVTGLIRLYDRLSGEVREIQAEGRWIRRAAITADGRQVVVASHGGAIEIYNVRSGEREARCQSSRMAPNIAIAPGDELVLGTSYDGPIELFRRRTGEAIRLLVGHTALVPAAAFTRDGEEIITVGFDGTIRVWSQARGIQVRGTRYRRMHPETLLAAPRSDEPSHEDLLDLSGEIDALASIVAASSTQPPLSIALLGDWGTGKSSFMLQMEDRVATLAGMTLNNLGSESAYVANVIQIPFNAWHYSDDSVWTGLIEQLFRKLGAELGTVVGTEVSAPDVTRRRDELREQLAETESMYKSVDEVLRTFTEASQLAPGRYDPALHGGYSRLTWRRYRLYLPIVLIATTAVIFLWVRYGPSPASIGVTVGLFAGFVQLCRSIAHWIEGARQVKQGHLEDRRSKLCESVADLKGELARVDAAARLASFIQERLPGDRYARFRGVVGEVHQDLRDLDDHLRAAYQEWLSSGSETPPPLQRIVLYIDDLDRCRPERVVQTLEAVHLLLALPLFIVVVGVDARWLLRSLHHHHSSLFTGAEHPPEADVRQVADVTLDYLDKIFQIPYALRPMDQHASLFMRSLLEDRDRMGGGSGPIADSTLQLVEGSPGFDAGRAGGRGPREPDSLYDGRLGEFQKLQDTLAPGLGQSASTESMDLNPPQMRLRAAELAFIPRLGPLLPTPRAVKKFINLYRLIRIGISEGELAAFVGGSHGGPYQVVLVLLAVIVGRPSLAASILTAITDADSGGEDIITLFRRLAEVGGLPSDARMELRKIAELIESIRSEATALGQLAEYQAWCPKVARLSFFTRTLY
jgi:WD40 repeat protein